MLTARELRLVLTLLLVMFMTGEAWRYVGALTGPRLVVLIAGPVLAAFALIGVGLGRQIRPAETVRVPGATGDARAHAVIAPRVAHRRLVARARVRVWLETLLVSLAVAGLFGFLGLATVDAELTLIVDLLEGYNRAVTVWAADEAGSAGEPTATQNP